MADLSITAANVKPISNLAEVRRVQWGETVTQGNPVYRHTDGMYYKCDNNDTAAKAACEGVAFTPGLVNEYGYIQVWGPMNLGATLVAGTIYAVSSNVGAICPIADWTTGHYRTPLGIASSTSLIFLSPAVSGVQT